jgi:ribonuclease Z
LTSNGVSLIIDAGSGLLMRQSEPDGVVPPINIVLSHLHIDHIIGLSAFAPVWDKSTGVRIFAGSEKVFGAFKPPYWPLTMEQAAHADIFVIKNGEGFSPDGVFTVLPFAASHPDGCMSFKITDGEKTFVYLLDYETDTASEEMYFLLKENCRNADLVIFDASYHPDGYSVRRGWGHSTLLDGVRLADECGCKKMLFSHYSPEYTDKELDKWPGILNNTAGKGRFVFARDGMEMEI